ncbi:MAG: response regulator [Pelosinus sp.]|nr:response regulator [Pelosinus sp.]
MPILANNTAANHQKVILIVDDSILSRKMLRNILEPDGYTIVEGANGVEAVDLFSKHQPDAVLLDIVMPIMDGLEACAQIKKLPEGKRTPIFMITSVATKEAISNAFEAGAIDYFSKPPNEMVIIQRLRRVIEARSWEDALISSQQRLHTITATMGEGLYVLNADGNVTFLNPEAEYILGWNPEEVLGKSPTATFYPEPHSTYPDAQNSNLEPAAAQEPYDPLFSASYDEHEYRHSNGEKFPVSSVARDFPDGKGCVVVFRDITAKKRAEEQLRQDILLASRIQKEFLPGDLDNLKLRLDTIYHPSSHVSGDLFDYAWSPDGNRLFGYIADVMGHGIATALQASTLRAIFNVATDKTSPPNVRLATANNQIFSCFAAGSFAGALCFELDFTTNTLSYSAAGINEFLAVLNSTPQKLEVPGHFLGIIKDKDYALHTINFAPGDSFFFMTDGIAEYLPENWMSYAYPKLKKLLALFAVQSADDATALCLNIK